MDDCRKKTARDQEVIESEEEQIAKRQVVGLALRDQNGAAANQQESFYDESKEANQN